jgi:hypothetical protein
MKPKILETRLAEFDATCAQMPILRQQLSDLMRRHAAAGGAINRRASRGKNTSDASDELRAVFASYPGTLRALGNHLFRLATIAEDVQKELL